MILVLLTSCFPYNGEVFLKYELPVISRYFERIDLIPTNVKDVSRKQKFNFLDNVIIRMDLSRKIHYMIHLNRVLWKEFFSELKDAGIRIFNAKLILKFLHRFLRSYGIYRILKREYKDDENICFYSYWLSFEALALALLRNKGFERSLMISRAHGSDIFHESSIGGYNPFIKFIIRNIDHIFSVSETGRKYLVNKYGYADKVSVSRLGVPDPKVLNKPSNDDTLRIVSCSSLNPLKRVDLIIKALHMIDYPISWVHFGDGPLRKSIIKLAHKLLDHKKNVKWMIRGKVPLEYIHNYYKNNPVDVFITTSSSEGIPVSIMEALSYGIPIIATNVGGISEIVGKDNGFLISNNYESIPKNIVDILARAKSKLRNSEYRKNIRRNWKNHYYSEDNFRNFSIFLLRRLEI